MYRTSIYPLTHISRVLRTDRSFILQVVLDLPYILVQGTSRGLFPGFIFDCIIVVQIILDFSM
jgi:hypothetical protein